MVLAVSAALTYYNNYFYNLGLRPIESLNIKLHMLAAMSNQLASTF